MDLTVIGTELPGLVTGACFAEAGHDVACVDPDPRRVRRLSRDALDLPVAEPGLADLVARNLEAGRLRFTSDGRAAIRSGRVIFLSPGCPDDPVGPWGADRLLATAREVGSHMTDEKVVVTLGPVPVGTAREVRSEIECRTAHPVHVCVAPGLLREGTAVADFRAPAKVVLGVEGERSRTVLGELYGTLLPSGSSPAFTDPPSAEFASYASVGRLASRIGFMNLIARSAGPHRTPVGPVAHAAASAGLREPGTPAISRPDGGEP